MYTNWIRWVDAVVADNCRGMTSADFPTFDFSAWFAEGVTANEAARRVIEWATTY